MLETTEADTKNTVKSDTRDMIRVENEIAESVNQYFTLYSEICEQCNISNQQLTKTFLSMKSTERDEMKVSLLNSIRGAYLTTEEKDGVIKVKECKTTDLSSKAETDQLNVYNPLKLIHGGFTPLSVRESHLKFKDNIPLLLKLLHLRGEIFKMIESIDSRPKSID